MECARLWKKEHLPDFPPKAFEQIVAGAYSKSDEVAWMACAAMWCVAVSSNGRKAVLKEGCMDALQAVVDAASSPATAEHGGPDKKFTCAIRDKLFVHAIGALGVLVVDKSARDAYVTLDPSFKKLVGACKALVLDPPLEPPSEEALEKMATDDDRKAAVRVYNELARDRRRARSRRRVMAAETLASALLRDSDARVALLRAEGMSNLTELLASDHVAVKLACSVILSLYARDPAGYRSSPLTPQWSVKPPPPSLSVLSSVSKSPLTTTSV